MGEWVGFTWMQAHGSGLTALVLIAAVGAGGGICAIVTLLLEAIDHAQLSQKQACAEMRIEQSHWHRQTIGEARNHVSLQRIGQLPALVLAWFGVLLYAQYGPIPEIERGAMLHFGVSSMRMAKASMPASTDMEAAS